MMIYLIPLALYALPALAAPPPLLQITQAQNPVPGRYIVTLKKGQGTPDTIDDNLFSSDMFPTSNVTHRWRPMNAFAGDFSSDDLETLRADPRVNTIEQDSIVRAFSSATQYALSPNIIRPLKFPDIHQTRSETTLRGA